MSTSTFSITTGADDQYMQLVSGSYPATGTPTRDSANTFLDVTRSSGYTIRNILLKFDTSSLPDDAIITSAILRLYATNKTDANALSLTAGWYQWDGTSNSDLSTTPETDAHSGTALSGITTSASNDFALSSVSNISSTGNTYLRLHISQRAGDAAPTGVNDLQLASFEAANPEPQLIVTYITTGPQTFYGLGSLASGAGYLDMQDGGTAPTAAELSPLTRLSPASGSARALAAEMADYWAQVGRAPAAFSATAAPLTPDNTNGNGFRTPSTFSGSFASGNWSISISAIARTNAWNGRHRFRLRVFRSTSATGASPTEITASTIITDTTSANVSQNATDTRTATWSAPAITLSNEYLLFTLAMEVTTAGTTVSGGRDLNLYGGSGLSIATTDFTPAGPTQAVGMIPI